MSDRNIALTESQYENLINILSIRPSNYKNISKHIDELLKTLPDDLVLDVNSRMSTSTFNGANSEDYLSTLFIIDSQKHRSSGDLILEFKDMAEKNPSLFVDILDLIFVKKDIRTQRLGRLLKSRIAIGAAKAKLNHYPTLNYYTSLFTSTDSYDAEEVVKVFFEEFPEYSKDIFLLSKLVSSTSGTTNRFAVKIADDSVLHFLINVRNSSAKRYLEERMSSSFVKD